MASDAFYADPYPTYARLRAEHPIYWCEPWRSWIVTRHADVMAMLHAPTRYSSAGRQTPLLERLPAAEQARLRPLRRIFETGGLLNSDPPDHTRLRRLVQRARAGLFVQLDAEAGDGTRTTIGTDGQWRVHPAQGWRRDVGLVSVTVGVTEVYDARADPPDWHATGFDDDAWEPAQVIAEQMASWAYLEPRQTPMLQEVDEHPARVVEQGEIIELSRMAADVQVPERLAVEPHLPLQHARIDRPGNALAAGGEPAVLQRCSYRPGDDPRQGVRSPYLIFDFGRQVFGFPRLHLDGPAGAVVEMTYGPVLMAGRIMPMANQLRYGDRYLMRAGAQVWQTFEYKQFRYLQVVVRGTDQPVRLHAAGVRAYRYPAERTGSFACSDPVLNALWQASIDTVDLHMEDGLVCDAARERRFWPGAGALGLYAVWAAYGDVALTDWHLRLTARGQLGDGLLRAWYPGTEGRYRGEQTADPLTATVFEDPKNYPTETLYFTIIAGDHQRYLGGSDAKRRLAAELYPRLIRAAGWFERQRDADGVLYQLPKEIFIDWMPHDMRGASFTLNVLYARFLAVLGDLAESLEEPDEAASWRAQASRLREHLRASHWDDRRGLFVDSVFAGERSRTVSELSNGMALVFGVADERQTARIVAHLEQPPEDLLRTTPLILFFVLEGLAAAGRTDLAVRIMRERYAPMMAATDAPTMWESWSPGLDAVAARPGHPAGRRRLRPLPDRAAGGAGFALGARRAAGGARADRGALAAAGRDPDPAGRPARRARHRSRAAARRPHGPAADPRRDHDRHPRGRRCGRRRRAVAGIAHPAAHRRHAPDGARTGAVSPCLL